MRYGEIRAKLSEPIIVELPGVVQDEDIGNFKSTNDTFPHEISCIFLSDFGEWFCFNPLSEVINSDDQKFSL